MTVVLGRKRVKLRGATHCDVRAKAEATLIDLGASIDSPSLTLSGAAAVYVTERMKREAWSLRTASRMRQDLALFADPPKEPARSITKAFMQRFIDERLAPLSLASQRTRWGAVAGFLVWCECRGILERSPHRLIHHSDKPWCGRRARRRMGRGKAQLRNAGEVRAYIAAAMQEPDAGRCVASLLPLLCGLRSGEVRHLLVADIDFDLDRIWIRPHDDEGGDADGWDVKSAAGQRTVAMPHALRADLSALMCFRAPGDLLLASPHGKSPEGPFNVSWLQRLVATVCERAGVRLVAPHGLRGTYATMLSALAGASAPDVAQLVGHGDAGETARQHYIGTADHQPALGMSQGNAASAVYALGSARDAHVTPSGSRDLWRSGRDLNPHRKKTGS